MDFLQLLKIKEGEEVPLSVCDPEDIRKSWLVGSLKRVFRKWMASRNNGRSSYSRVSHLLSYFVTEQMAMHQTKFN